MNTNYLETWAELVKTAQKPMQDLAELNMKAIKEFDPKVFDKVFSAKKPEEIIEINVNLAVEQGKKSLDYFQQSMKIFEKSASEMAKEVKVVKDKAAKDKK